MSTILARRLKASRAQPILIRDMPLSVDLSLTTGKKEEQASWTAVDSDYDSYSASSSSSSSSFSLSTPSIFFEDMDDLSEETVSPNSICPACEGDSEAEESWNEHVYQREITSSRSHRESSRRTRSSSSSSSSKSRRSTPASATVCPPSSFRPSARSSRRKQVPSSSPPTSSSSSSDEEDARYKSTSRLRRSKRLADCECDPLACPPSPHPQAVELCPVVEARLRTTVNPSFYLIYTLENVMMRGRKIRYPLKDRATHLSFGTCRGSLGDSPLRSELLVR